MVKLIDLNGLAHVYSIIKGMLADKLGKNDTAAAAIKDGAGNNIVDTYAKKTDISGMVKSVNGKEPDAGGNVNVANMAGASDSAAGKAGLVPAPAAGMQNKFLCADATWKDAGGLPVGHEFFTTNPNIPAGCIPLLGGEYSRTAYADLWAWVQTQQGYLIEESAWQTRATANSGNVPFYSKGDGTTTFRVPSLKCWVKGANGIEEVGSYLSAGLPNIIANYDDNIGYANADMIGWHGAVYLGNLAISLITSNRNDDGKKYCHNWKFDASKSNPIYGNSDTVQPKSIVGMWLVKAYGTITNVGSTDVAAIAQGLTELETNKLSTNGGTMTGDIYFNNPDFGITKDRNEYGSYDVGWSWENRKGAGAGFRSIDYTKESDRGAFIIYARNETTHAALDGYPDGTLKWNNKEIALKESLSMPSGNYANISISGFVPNSDSKYYYNVYTAPADGWIYIYCTLSSSPTSGYKVALLNDTKKYSVRYIHTKTAIERDISLMMPVSKGDVIDLDTAWMATINLTFYYAKSEV